MRYLKLKNLIAIAFMVTSMGASHAKALDIVLMIPRLINGNDAGMPFTRDWEKRFGSTCGSCVFPFVVTVLEAISLPVLVADAPADGRMTLDQFDENLRSQGYSEEQITNFNSDIKSKIYPHFQGSEFSAEQFKDELRKLDLHQETLDALMVSEK